MVNKERGDEALKKLEKSLKTRDYSEAAKPVKIAAVSAGVIVLIAGGIYWANSQSSDTTSTEAESSSTSETAFAPLPTSLASPLPDTVQCTYTKSEEKAAKKVSLPSGKDISTKGTVKLNLVTNQGDIGLTLDRSVAPCTVNAFVSLAKAKYFDNTVCHRLMTEGIKILQCGDPTATGTGGPGFTLPDEYPADGSMDSGQTVNYGRGTLAVANTGAKNTGGSQFFMNYGDSPLTPTYTYFGSIDEDGLKVLDKIAEKGTKADNPEAPVEEVKITSATVES